MSQTRNQKRFTISEVAADWHELMIPQRTMQPSIARVSEQLDPWFAASRHTTAPISHTIGLCYPVWQVTLRSSEMGLHMHFS